MNYLKLYQNYKKIKNLTRPIQEGMDAAQYGQERAMELLSQGYSTEQAKNIIQSELLLRYGGSTIGKEIAKNTCTMGFTAGGNAVGNMIEPGIGGAIGSFLGEELGDYTCDTAIKKITDFGIKKISEKSVQPANPPKKQELKDIPAEFKSLDPHIETQPAKYFMEKPFNSPSIDRDPEGVFQIRIEKNVPTSKYQGYTNPLSKDNRIFTREDIGDFSTQEYADSEPLIMAQWGEIGIPTNSDLEHERLTNNGTVFVKGYTRSDCKRTL